MLKCKGWRASNLSLAQLHKVNGILLSILQTECPSKPGMLKQYCHACTVGAACFRGHA